MTGHSYFVVMIDFGKRGREAVVDPELTRRDVVSLICSKDYTNIVFVHYVHDGVCEDVTEELTDEARNEALQAAE